jgi:hypothetical protein
LSEKDESDEMDGLDNHTMQYGPIEGKVPYFGDDKKPVRSALKKENGAKQLYSILDETFMPFGTSWDNDTTDDGHATSIPSDDSDEEFFDASEE